MRRVRLTLATATGVIFVAGVLALVVAAALPPATWSRGGPGDDVEFDYEVRTSRFLPLTDEYVRAALGGTAPVFVGALRDPGSDSGPDAAGAASVRTRPSNDQGTGGPTGTNVTHPFANDDIHDAYEVSSLPFRARTSAPQATRQAGEPDGCLPTGGTLWYRYTPNSPRRLLASSFGTDGLAGVAVFRGDDPTRLDRVACDSDTTGNAVVIFDAALATYWFQITVPTGPMQAAFSLEVRGTITRASLSTSGAQGDHSVGNGLSVSADGRYVAFTSGATNLAPGTGATSCAENDPLSAAGLTPCKQLYLRDRAAGTTTLVSRSPNGAPGDANTENPQIAANGRFLVFESAASNLVAGDRGPTWDVFVHDLLTGSFERLPGRASDPATGTQQDVVGWFMPTISADGRYVAFQSLADDLVPGDTNGAWDVFVRDRLTRTTERVSVSSDGAQTTTDDAMLMPSISADGRAVIFSSRASDLVAGDTNNVRDTFVHDRSTRRTERVSVATSGEQANDESTIVHGSVSRVHTSSDGRRVVFASMATNLVPGDTNGAVDIFVRDRVEGTTTRASVSSDGEQGRISGDATYESGQIGNTYAISLDGRFVAFDSFADNLAPGDRSDSPTQDVYVRDLATGMTSSCTLASGSNDWPAGVAISGDARAVAFVGFGSSYVADDTNGFPDTFVYDRTERIDQRI